MSVITDNGEVAALCKRLAQAEYITVDTEFMRERTYWSQLCLIQLAGPDEAAAIDPLAPGIDLSPVLDLMQNEKVLKVFHAARQDLEIFHHMTGAVPHPVFDTQVAAMVCGFGDQVSYEILARKLANASIDKDSRFTDWARRPLTEKQVTYALADVTHLRKAYEKLRAMLEENGRAVWIEEEMAVLASPSTYMTEAGDAWQRIKIKGRKPRIMAVLRELAAWREDTAQKRDVPRQRVVKDDGLAQIAIQQPTSPEDLERVRLVPHGFSRSDDGKAIVEAVKRGLAVPKEDLPAVEYGTGKPENQAPAALIDLLKVLVRARCEAEGIAPRLVANMAEVERFASDDADPDNPLRHGWRYDLFGRDAERLKRGELALAPVGDNLKLIEIG